MIINSVSIRDLGPHQELDISFGNGISCILGANGCGKSSVLDAIRYAFTDSFDSDGNKEDNIRHGATQGSVHVDFSHNGHDYTISRRLSTKRGGNRVSLVGDSLADGELTKVGEIADFLASITKTNAQVMLENVFVPQGKIDQVLFQREAERLKGFQGVFGLTNAKKAVDLLAKETTKYNVTLNLEQRVTQARTELEVSTTQYQEAVETKAKAEALVEELKPLTVRLNTELQRRSLHARVASYQEEYAESAKLIAETRQQHANAESECAKIEKDLAAVGDVSDVANKVAQLRQVMTLRGRLADIPDVGVSVDEQAQLAEARTRLPKIREQVGILRGYLTDPQSRPQSAARVEADAAVAAAEGPAAEAAAALEAFDQQLRQLTADHQKAQVDAAGAICGACKRPFDAQASAAAQAHAQSLATQVAAKKAEREQLKAVSDTAAAALLAAQDVRAQVVQAEDGSIRARLAQGEDAERRAQETVDTLSERLSASEVNERLRSALFAELAGLPDCDNPLTEIAELERVQQTHQEYSAKLVQAKSTAQRLQERAEELAARSKHLSEKIAEFSAEDEFMPQEEFDALTEKTAGYLDHVAAAQEAAQRLRGAQAAVDNAQSSLDALLKQVESEAKDATWVAVCQAARDALRPGGLPALMMAEYAKLINERIAYYLELWQAPFALRIVPEQGFAFIANKDGFDMASTRLSGGEKVVASTSFRFAMADTFAAEVGLLVIDEPSAYLDEQNIHNLQDLLIKLREFNNTNGRQIIMVTHEEALLGFVDQHYRLYHSDS